MSSRQILGNLVRTCFKTKHVSLYGFTYSKKEEKEDQEEEGQAEEKDRGECLIHHGRWERMESGFSGIGTL